MQCFRNAISARSLRYGRSGVECAVAGGHGRAPWGLRRTAAMGASLCSIAMASSVVGAVVAAPAGAAPAPRAVQSAPHIPSGSHYLGHIDPSTTVRFTVSLNPADPGGLAALASAVSTPGSSQYRHYISTQQFAQHFGAPRATVAAMVDYLAKSGSTGLHVSANHLQVSGSAGASALQAAFSTRIGLYRLASGRIAYANTSAPKLPSDIAPSVQSVAGLDDLVQLHPAGGTVSATHQTSATSPPGAPIVSRKSAGPTPCADAAHASQASGSLTADLISSAYSMNSLYQSGLTGSGQTIAVFEISGYAKSDIATYQSCYGTNVSYSDINVDGGPTDSNGAGEVEGDMEVLVGEAPGASILLYNAPNGGSGIIDEYAKIINDNKAKIISTSWGYCELDSSNSGMQSENTLFQQASVQGQTIFAAAGDNGSEDCSENAQSPNVNALAVDFPGSDSYVTGVGGTTITALGPPPTETVWNDGPPIGTKSGGGGISTMWSMPSWQTGPGVINQFTSGAPCAAQPGNCREDPDVSATAGSNSAYTLFEPAGGAATWVSGFGTSFAAPLWAAIMTLVNQSCGTPVGFANPTFYKLAAGANSPFNDVTTGNNDYLNLHGGEYPATKGYDMASGLGTPIASKLLSGFCNATPPSTVPVVTSVTPSSGTTAGGTKVTIAGTGFTGATAVQFGSAAATGVSVASDTSITATSPAGATGQVDVTVTGPGGTSAKNPCGDAFDYGSSPPSVPAGSFTSLAQPTRIADTRPGSGQADQGRTLGACSTLDINVAGAGGIPSGATAAFLNVTAVSQSAGGYLTVNGAGVMRPLASNLNFGPNQAVPNLVEVPLGTGGQIEVYNGSTSPTDVIVDAAGYVTTGSSGGLFTAMAPARLCDTRTGSGFDCSGGAPAPQTSLTIIVDGHGGVPASGVAAVVLNVTAINPSAPGYLTVYPDGTSLPTASNVNYAAGQTVPNRVIVPVGNDGNVNVYSFAGTPDIVMDVGGYFTAGGSGVQLHPLSPARITDTRSGSGLPNAGATLGSGATLPVSVAGAGGVPAQGAKAVVANVTVTNTTGSSFLTAYPSGTPPPTASDLNWVAGETVPNLVVVQIGSDGKVDLFNSSGSTDVIVDVVGWFG